ncbi:MAG: hypothetical protein HOW97_42345 [Catenulispora sp.]|nr:hypothetical protein [Catenulispora sp.]
MALPKRARVVGLSLVTAAVVGAGAVAAFTAGAAGSSSGTVTARFAKTSDWGNGFQAEYTITNSTGQSVHGWTLSFDLPAGERISSLWDGTMTTAGQRITVTNPAWGGDIATGTDASFGFVVDAGGGSGEPQNCQINGASCSSGAPGGSTATAPSTVPSTVPSTAPSTAPSTGPGSAPSSAQPSTASATTAPTPSLTPTNPSTGPSSNPSSAPPQAAGDSYKFAPYVDTSQRQDLGALASTAGVKYVTAAFVLSGSGCTPSWNGANGSDPAFIANLKTGLADLRSKGGDAIASFGGANGTELAQACTDVTSLKAAYKEVIDEYAFTHIDFDIEGTAGTDQETITRRWQALSQLQSDYAAAGKPLDVSLTLPVLPSGLTPEGIGVVAAAAADGVRLSVVNVLAMDYGDWAAPSPAGKLGQFADQAAQSLHDQLKGVFPAASDTQLWSMVGITPMIGMNDTASEVFQISDARAVQQFAAQHHIGRLAMWSLTRDKACAQSSTWADPTCSSIQQGPYDFSHTFEAFAG